MPGAQPDTDQVRCVACGQAVERSTAREYDRFGDRWERDDKRFEYLCKDCHRDYSHQPREGLEATLTSVGTRPGSPGAFIAAYYAAVEGPTDAEDSE